MRYDLVLIAFCLFVVTSSVYILLGSLLCNLIRYVNVDLVMMVQNNFAGSTYDELMLDFEDAVLKQRSSCLPGSKLSGLKEDRFQSRVQHRLTELEGIYRKL